jgi:hypothetical protein
MILAQMVAVLHCSTSRLPASQGSTRCVGCAGTRERHVVAAAYWSKSRHRITVATFVALRASFAVVRLSIRRHYYVLALSSSSARRCGDPAPPTATCSIHSHELRPRCCRVCNAPRAAVDADEVVRHVLVVSLLFAAAGVAVSGLGASTPPYLVVVRGASAVMGKDTPRFLVFGGNNSALIREALQRRPWWTVSACGDCCPACCPIYFVVWPLRPSVSLPCWRCRHAGGRNICNLAQNASCAAAWREWRGLRQPSWDVGVLCWLLLFARCGDPPHVARCCAELPGRRRRRGVRPNARGCSVVAEATLGSAANPQAAGVRLHVAGV